MHNVAGMMAVQNQKMSYNKKLYALPLILFERSYFDLCNVAGKASPGSVICLS